MTASEVEDIEPAGDRVRAMIDDVIRQVEDAERRRPPMPASIEGYEILGELGRGGMGTVYRARQPLTLMEVALKVVRPERFSAARQRRFLEEIRHVGRLHHEGIARVYLADRFEGARGDELFFAMELVEGERITRYASAHDLDARERLGLIARVCDAVQHAHQRFVMHLDLKPANILVDHAGNPKVLDFGVARATTSAGEGRIEGTLEYMSPEQVAGDDTLVDARSDVYALGVITYRLLSGEMPYDFGTGDLDDVKRVIREEPPTPLGEVDERLRGDVEAIVDKALRKDPDERYPSAAALADDIRRFLRREPISLRAHKRWYRVRRFLRRNRARVVATVLVVAAVGAGLTGTVWKAAEARNEARLADLGLALLSRGELPPAPWWLRQDDRLELLTLLSEWVDDYAEDDPSRKINLYDRLGLLKLELAMYDGAESLFRRSLTLAGSTRPPGHEQTLRLYAIIADVELAGGHPRRAQRTAEQGLAAAPMSLERAIADEVTIAHRIVNLEYARAMARDEQGFPEEAAVTYRRLLDVLKALLSDREYALHHQVFAVESSLAIALIRSNDSLDEAGSLLERARDYYDLQQPFATTHTAALRNLAIHRLATGDPEGAEEHLEVALALARGRSPTPAPFRARLHHLMGRALTGQGRLDDAVANFRTAVHLARARTPDHWRLAAYEGDYGASLCATGRADEGERLLRAAFASLEGRFGADDPRARRCAEQLADHFERQGREAETERWRGRLTAD